MSEVWSYLAHDPLLWLTLTLLAYLLGMSLFSALGRRAYLNPALTGTVLLATILHLTATPFATYFEGAQFVHFLLGPATVCLALPLYDNLPRVRRAALPLIASLLVGSLTAIISVLALAKAFGLPEQILAAMAPKSATAAVAMGIGETLGGSATMTVLMVMMTGITGAVIITPLMNLLGFTDWRARGFAVGVAAHGFGTARALQVNPTAGAFAGLAMGLNALLTAILAPIILPWFLN